MHIAVNTAMSLPLANPFETNVGISPIAAPAAPNAVKGTETHSGDENPNKNVSNP